MRWRLLLAYDGAPFRGFAAQPGTRTVAGEVAAALARALRLEEPPVLVCAGRTDAGVHARGQVVHVDLPSAVAEHGAGSPPRRLQPDDLCKVVNRQLAPAIVVLGAEPAPPGFDARRSAINRSYRYLVWNSRYPDPLLAPLAWHVPDALDLRAMGQAADAVVGEHDFRAFCRRPPGTSEDQPLVRRVLDVRWTESTGLLAGTTPVARPSRAGREGLSGRLLCFEIVAASFCHQMVRSLVSAQVEIGKGRDTAASLVFRLRGTPRAGLPQPAPPHGLCLVSVDYP